MKSTCRLSQYSLCYVYIIFLFTMRTVSDNLMFENSIGSVHYHIYTHMTSWEHGTVFEFKPENKLHFVTFLLFRPWWSNRQRPKPLNMTWSSWPFLLFLFHYQMRRVSQRIYLFGYHIPGPPLRSPWRKQFPATEGQCGRRRDSVGVIPCKSRRLGFEVEREK